MEWVLIGDTKLAKETSPKRAGQIFAICGISKKRVAERASGKQTTLTYVDARVKDLSEAEIRGITVFKEAGAIVPTPPPSGEPAPTYAELVETVEKQDALINELRDEVRQLRQHIASIQHRNGMGERARKALSAARQTLSLVNGE